MDMATTPPATTTTTTATVITYNGSTALRQMSNQMQRKKDHFVYGPRHEW